jgi:hypothetical protein
MEIECKEVVKIDDGLHVGVISSVTYRDTPYSYTDLLISMNEGRTVMKVGYPTMITEDTALGKLVASFGVELRVGAKYNIEKLFVGKKVQFLTLKKKSKIDGKEYSNILRESIKPVGGLN